MYPVTYEADYQPEQNRATTFFRIILAIPWIIVGIVYSSYGWVSYALQSAHFPLESNPSIVVCEGHRTKPRGATQ